VTGSIFKIMFWGLAEGVFEKRERGDSIPKKRDEVLVGGGNFGGSTTGQ